MEKTLVLALSILLSIATSALCGENIDAEFTADFKGKYIWRGQNVTDEPVFQPGFSISKSGLTAFFWGNLELTNVNDKSGDFSEIDCILDYSADLPGIKGVKYSIGTIYYEFPGSTADGTKIPTTLEVYWGLSLDLPLGPSITTYHDLDEAEGTYVLIAAGHSIENITEIRPNMPIGIEIEASLGWGDSSYNKYYWGIDQSKLNDLSFSIAFPIEMSGWVVSPGLNYITLVSDDIRDTDVYGTNSDFFFAWIGLAKKF